MYTLIEWLNATSQPTTRKDVPFALAYSIATNSGNYKTQIVDALGVIVIETRNDITLLDQVVDTLVKTHKEFNA